MVGARRVGQDAHSCAGAGGRYRLGFGIVRLAGAVAGGMDVTRHERLARELGETVNLAVGEAHERAPALVHGADEISCRLGYPG